MLTPRCKQEVTHRDQRSYCLDNETVLTTRAYKKEEEHKNNKHYRDTMSLISKSNRQIKSGEDDQKREETRYEQVGSNIAQGLTTSKNGRKQLDEPKQVERYRTKNREAQQRHMDKIRQDPQKLEERRAKNRAAHQRYFDKLSRDPEKMARYKAQQRESGRKYRQMLATDPERSAKRRAQNYCAQQNHRRKLNQSKGTQNGLGDQRAKDSEPQRARKPGIQQESKKIHLGKHETVPKSKVYRRALLAGMESIAIFTILSLL